MKRLCLALAVAALLLLVAGVGTATANPPGSQTAGQSAGSDQDAGSAAGTAQDQPTNENSSVRVLSPGDEGDVSQTNEATSDATATNLNATEQTADQTQAGSGGLQAIGQSSTNDQGALAFALTAQTGASNENAPVRVLSKGDGGDVEQSNVASSDATAGNANYTGQTADQEQSGDSCKCGSGGDQLIGQSADSEQDAAALAATSQEHPSNTNVSVRVLSPGSNGAVTQTNEATSNANAGNLNVTEQDADQTQAGDSCKCGSGGDQAIGQAAESDQKAVALSGTVQEKPKNTNVSVRVLSPGDDGPVTQTNTASSNATAGNVNGTTQTAGQAQGGGSGSQAIGQSSKNDQTALAGALTIQKDPSNENISVRVLSPGSNGDVTQTNKAASNANAGNLNLTGQTANQTQTGGPCICQGAGEQLIGQKSDSEQNAAALAGTIQVKPSNDNNSVRVLSKGDDGSVEQTNKATSDATAANLNGTTQTASQAQGGSGLQAIGQSAKNDQDAFALGFTAQLGASNENAPVRVLSKGDGGDVEQSNIADSDAKAVNLNGTHQEAAQRQAGDSCKCGHGGEQLIGQSADSEQGAAAIAATLQVKPSNENHPVRVLSKGDDGSVEQTNKATSDAEAGNLNVTKQTAAQAQGGSGLQAIGQSSKNEQDAFALGLTAQLGASNENAPVRVLSKGDGGDVEQSNVASSNATAGNLNATHQGASQLQLGDSCKCGHGGEQLIGQSAESKQGAAAIAATVQLKPSNENHPVRVLSKGDDGSVEQTNKATSDATAANLNVTKQDAEQAQAGSGLQAIGQSAKNAQGAFALGLTFQLGASNENAPLRVLSPGYGGSVSQANIATSNAEAGNANFTEQAAGQLQGGGGNHCCGAGIQAIGQLADNHQAAIGLAATVQLGLRQPCVCGKKDSIGNSNAPTRVKSPGDDGSLRQANVASSTSTATNWNAVKQAALEIQPAPCVCKAPRIQAVGQLDKSDQLAVSGALGFQLDPKNAAAPKRDKSPGKTGDRHQMGKEMAADDAGSSSLSDRFAKRVEE